VRAVLLRRAAVPRDRLGIVLHHAATLVERFAKIELSARVALVRSLLELVERALVVPSVPGVESLLEVRLDGACQRHEKDERRKTSHCSPPKDRLLVYSMSSTASALPAPCSSEAAAASWRR